MRPTLPAFGAGLLLLAIGYAGLTLEQIDTGNVGVVSVFGQVRDEALPPGVYSAAFKKVIEVSTKETPIPLNDMRPQTSDKITLADLDVDVYVQIDPQKAPAILTRWPGDAVRAQSGEGLFIGNNYVSRMAREAVYDAVSKHGSERIHTQRNELSAQILASLQADLDESAGKHWFSVRSVNIRNLLTDPALEESIKAAAKAQFERQRKDQEIEIARKEAERKRIEAQGDADAIRVRAEAIAKQGGDAYVHLKAIEKWDGKLPTTMPGSAVPLVPLK